MYMLAFVEILIGSLFTLSFILYFSLPQFVLITSFIGAFTIYTIISTVYRPKFNIYLRQNHYNIRDIKLNIAKEMMVYSVVIALIFTGMLPSDFVTFFLIKGLISGLILGVLLFRSFETILCLLVGIIIIYTPLNYSLITFLLFILTLISIMLIQKMDGSKFTKVI